MLSSSVKMLAICTMKSRNNFCTFLIGAAVLLSTTTYTTAESQLGNRVFVHPGVLHTAQDIQRMKEGIAAGEQPFVDGLRLLQQNPLTDPNWNPRPTETTIRGNVPGQNVATMFIDVHRAYQCALLWAVTDSAPHGKAACRILNAWAERLKKIDGNADRFLAAGLHGFQFAAAELMREHPNFDVPAMQQMLKSVFFTVNRQFLVGTPEGGRDHNDACITNYWANWDLCNMASVIAIGIFCDDEEIFNLGIEYFKHGGGNGAIYNAVPFIHSNGLGQWQESGRDQPHTVMCIGQMGYVCEMAWSQGIDLYGWADNRFLRGAEYVARYNNGHDDVPFELYEWGTGQRGDVVRQDVLSTASRGQLRPVWELPYNHYVQRKGLAAPNIEEMLAQTKPEGGPRPGNHASTFDQLGNGTLTFTRPKRGGSDAELPPGNIADGFYRFVSRMNGKVLQPLNSESEGMTPVVMATKNGEKSQIWNVRHLGGGQYEVINAQSGKALAIEGNALTMGASVVVSDKTAEGLKFAFHPTELVDAQKKLLTKHEFHYIRAGNSRNVLDVKDRSQEENAPVVQWRYLLNSNQQWGLEPVAED